MPKASIRTAEKIRSLAQAYSDSFEEADVLFEEEGTNETYTAAERRHREACDAFLEALPVFDFSGMHHLAALEFAKEILMMPAK